MTGPYPPFNGRIPMHRDRTCARGPSLDPGAAPSALRDRTAPERASEGRGPREGVQVSGFPKSPPFPKRAPNKSKKLGTFHSQNATHGVLRLRRRQSDQVVHRLRRGHVDETTHAKVALQLDLDPQQIELLLGRAVLERRVLGLPEERRRFSKFRRATVHGRGAVRLAHGHVASVDERLRRRLRRCLHSRGVRPDGDQQIVQVHRAAAVQASVLPVVRDEEGGGFLVSRHNFEKVVRRRKRGPLQRQQDEINHVHVQRRRRFVQRGVVFLHAQQHLDLFRRVALVLQQQLRQAAPAGGMGG
mmetsp:Transcript_22841/g.79404  ORF Transcript_22841/g.79404 Transcript_22841/m.79404 type:complete len:301 (-) Transcript_22841:1580-2482(-)